MSSDAHPAPRPAPKPLNDFWTRPSKNVEELAANPGLKPWTAEIIAEMHALGKKIWSEDDIEEVLAWLREIRRGGGSAKHS